MDGYKQIVNKRERFFEFSPCPAGHARPEARQKRGLPRFRPVLHRASGAAARRTAAAAYSDPNTEILIRGKRWEDGVAVTIQNQGPAIPAEKLSAIFEKFYRTDKARASDTGGAGLGLAIAKEIVALHGGTITAESRENTTTFTVTLPGSPSENLNPPLGSS